MDPSPSLRAVQFFSWFVVCQQKGIAKSFVEKRAAGRPSLVVSQTQTRLFKPSPEWPTRSGTFRKKATSLLHTRARARVVSERLSFPLLIHRSTPTWLARTCKALVANQRKRRARYPADGVVQRRAAAASAANPVWEEKSLSWLSRRGVRKLSLALSFAQSGTAAASDGDSFPVRPKTS